MINKLIATLLLALPLSVLAETYECKEHGNVITVGAYGTEHVNHKVRLNGKKRIMELENELWFIEEVSCSKQGFNIVASHAQYGDKNTKAFKW